ncbi:MAG: hypothetical protein FWC41_08955, partial [Firmicutes bacterium]|nr:hypothetical protein [Bacillota bacterium]
MNQGYSEQKKQILDELINTPISDRMETLITNIRNDEYSWVTDKNIAIGLETLSIDELLANIRRLIDDEKDILAYVDLCSFVIEKIRTVEFGRLLTLIRRDK